MFVQRILEQFRNPTKSTHFTLRRLISQVLSLQMTEDMYLATGFVHFIKSKSTFMLAVITPNNVFFTNKCSGQFWAEELTHPSLMWKHLHTAGYTHAYQHEYIT